MPTLANGKVTSYSVIVEWGTGVSSERRLRVELEGGIGRTRAELRFSSVLAPYVVSAPGGVRVSLPLNYFDAMYHLLQTERPVFFDAELAPGDPPTYYTSMSTTIDGLGMEVPGEGPADKSP